MRKIIIAEKPSLAKSIMAALETEGEIFSVESKGEYYVSENYYVTAVFGHLFELKDINDYGQNQGKNMWSVENLPYFPSQYEYVLKEGSSIKKRYATIKGLVNKPEVSEVIHCGDPDREGQVIVDIVLEQAGCNKPVTRPLWRNLSAEEICSAIKERQPNDEYVDLRKEGLVRAYIDNDFGKNFSRYATVKTGAKPALNVGRVIGAIVTAIYEREKAIAEFVPEKYYKIESDVNGIKLTSKEKFEIEKIADAKAYADRLNEQTVVVEKIEQKEIKKSSPKLFSQTSLQATLNKRYGYSPDKSLTLAQNLYEKGLTTYPRTNTEYLSDGEKSEVEKIIRGHDLAHELTQKELKSIYDDSKIEGHTAIIPTMKKAGGLSEDEQNCYDTIFNRFKAVFCKRNCIYNQTKATIKAGTIEEFTIKGETLVSAGWQVYEPPKDEDKEKVLPDIKQGDVLEVKFLPIEAETKPPKSYTVESLGKFLQNPFRKEMDTEDEIYKNILAGAEIGTEATRAGIIKKAIDKGYISLKKSTYKIEDRGKQLIQACNELGIDVSKEKTAEMGKATKDVYKGIRTIDEVLTKVRSEIEAVIKSDPKVTSMAMSDTSLGKCPLCGAKVIESPKSYCCENWKAGCEFKIWKTICDKKITPNQASTIINGETTSLLKGFKSKQGKPFAAKLKLKADKTGVEFEFGKK